MLKTPSCVIAQMKTTFAWQCDRTGLSLDYNVDTKLFTSTQFPCLKPRHSMVAMAARAHSQDEASFWT